VKNRLTDLNDILFAQLERLSDESLKPDQVRVEIERTHAVVDVADKIVSNARLMLDGAELAAKYGDRIKTPLLTAGSNSNGDSNGTAKP
jgi:hypothetical protein